MSKDLHGLLHKQVAEGLIWTGLALEKVDKLQQSLQYCKEALEMRRSLYKEDSWEVGNALWNVGMIYRALGLVEAEMQHMDAAWKNYSKIYAGKGPDLNWLKASVGWAKCDLGYYEDALQCWLEVE